MKMEINQELAQRLFHEGATFICLGLPSGSNFGIDMKSFKTGDLFKGIKMIPPGVHFVYYSIENSHGDDSPRVGFLHYFKKSELIVKKWDSIKETLFDEENKSTIERLRVNLREIDNNLGPYPFEIWSTWKNLSSKISEELCDKVVPLCGSINSALELKASVNNKSTQNTVFTSKTFSKQNSKLFFYEEQNDFLSKLEALEGTEIRFSKIPDKCYPENSAPCEITKHCLDSSFLFEKILSQYSNSSDVLGEIQVAFICFLIGFSFEAFEHWKKLIGILCSCNEAISRHTNIFSDFISILNDQLQEVQEDILVDTVVPNNFVYKILRIFFRNLQSSDINVRLRAKGERFQKLLTKKLNWDFSDILEEDEEDLPVVVNF